MTTKTASAEERVIGFLNEQNRPLNVQNIADALQKFNIKKTQAQKILDAACSKGEISFKDYGKQRIYVARQDQFQIPSNEELEAMNKLNSKLQEEATSAQKACSELEAVVRGLESGLSTEQIEINIERLTRENERMEVKLVELRKGGQLVTEDERRKVEDTYQCRTAMWKQRKRVFNDLWGVMSEHVPKNLKDFAEEVGIETDEDLGIDIKDYCMPPAKKSRAC